MRRLLIFAVLVALALALALGEAPTFANAQASQICRTTSDPLSNLDYTDALVSACVSARCVATLHTAPTSTTGGFCNGVAASEASVPCHTLENAYNEYYACIMRALPSTTTANLTSVGAEVRKYLNTPGFPYHLTPLPCYACNHFRTAVFPSLSSSCTNWTCDAIASQSPDAAQLGQPGKGYNQRLCSTGCITAIMMIPFVTVFCAIFCICGCCCPSPSLKTTYAAMQKEEEEEAMKRHRQHGSDGSAHGEQAPDNNGDPQDAWSPATTHNAPA